MSNDSVAVCASRAATVTFSTLVTQPPSQPLTPGCTVGLPFEESGVASTISAGWRSKGMIRAVRTARKPVRPLCPRARAEITGETKPMPCRSEVRSMSVPSCQWPPRVPNPQAHSSGFRWSPPRPMVANGAGQAPCVPANRRPAMLPTVSSRSARLPLRSRMPQYDAPAATRSLSGVAKMPARSGPLTASAGTAPLASRCTVPSHVALPRVASGPPSPCHVTRSPAWPASLTT